MKNTGINASTSTILSSKDAVASDYNRLTTEVSKLDRYLKRQCVKDIDNLAYEAIYLDATFSPTDNLVGQTEANRLLLLSTMNYILRCRFRGPKSSDDPYCYVYQCDCFKEKVCDCDCDSCDMCYDSCNRDYM
jgi:hypothetical protein